MWIPTNERRLCQGDAMALQLHEMRWLKKKKKNHAEQKKGNHRRMYGLWYLCKIQKSLNDRVYCLEITRVQEAYF